MMITIVAVQLLKGIAQKVKAIDFPNPRKVHTYPIPKIGGIGMALGIFIPFIAWLPPMDIFYASVLIGGAIVVIEGFIDDTCNMNYKIKFLLQIAAALVVIFFGGIKITSLGMLLPEGFIIPEIPSILLTLFVIVGVTNAINLSDGLDGLAGGITLLSFICIGYLAFRVENYAILIISMSVCGAIFGFLRFNTFPADVFMGDAGSQLLGFLAITLALGLTQPITTLTPVLPLIILGFPVLDTLTVMVERIRNGRSPFAADKNHFHHKLMKLGLLHSEAVFTIYVLQTFLVIAALLLKYYSGVVLLLLYTVFSTAVIAGFYIAEKNKFLLKRYDLIDIVIKGQLRKVRDHQIFIKGFFGFIKYGLPVLLIIASLTPDKIPLHFSLVTVALAVGVSWILWFREQWLANAIRIAIYFSIPYLIYLGQNNTPEWMNGEIEIIYNAFYVLMTISIVMTLKITRRQKGFRLNPTDFLILFIAIAVPNLPGIKGMQAGIIVIKIIILMFGFEVLIGELRGKLKWLSGVTAMSMMAICIRGLL